MTRLSCVPRRSAALTLLVAILLGAASVNASELPVDMVLIPGGAAQIGSDKGLSD